MEQSKKFGNKLSNLEKSVSQFEDSLKIKLDKLNPVEQDAVMNGQIQKFEICIELCWKTIQSFLEEEHGIETVSPKTSIKEYYGINLIDDKEYELLIQMVEDRNKLSHIYNEMFFNEIHSHLSSYLTTFKIILNSLKKSNTN